MNDQPEYRTGDIFAESWKVEALVNPVNCVGVMGRDLATGALEGSVFDAIVEDLREARSEPIGSVVATVERLGERKGLPEGERGGVLHHLIQGGDLTKFGLSNAITRFSQDVESYDRASALELLGGEVITLPRHDWALISA